MSEPQYLELAVGTPAGRGRVIRVDQLRQAVRQNAGRPLWRSYYTFDESIRKQVKDSGALRKHHEGLRGLPAVVLDIDADELSDALDKTRELARFLQARDVPDELVRVWFSGRKGFHVHLPPALFGWEGGPVEPAAVTATLKGLNLGVDTKPTHGAGLIRVQWTPHQVTGLYKIPLRPYELFNESAESVKEMAASPSTSRKGFQWTEHEGAVEAALADVVRQEATTSRNARGLREEKKPDYVTCMWHLLKEGPTKGKRHKQLLRLVAHWAQAGLDEEAMFAAARDWLAGHNDFPDSEIRDEVHWALGRSGQKGRKSRFSCQDEVMQKRCDKACIFYRHKDKQEVTPTDHNEGMEAIMREAELQRDTYVHFDAFGISHRIYPGEVAMLIGNTKLGKSSLWHNVGVSNDHLSIVDYSPEIPTEGQHWKRYLQIQQGLTEQGIERIRNERPELLKQYMSELGRVRLLTETVDLDRLERIVRGASADVLIVDPIERVQVPEFRGNDFNQVKEVVQWCKDIARRLDVIVLAVNHISKAGQRRAEKGKSLNLSDSKMGKYVTEEANLVYAFEGERWKSKRTLRLLAATRSDVEPFTLTLQGEKETWRFFTENIEMHGEEKSAPPTGERLSVTSKEDLPK